MNKSFHEVTQQAPKVTAAYQADALRDSFTVPALKSAFLGVIAGALVGLLIVAADAPVNPWLVGLIVWLIVMGGGFWLFTEQARYLIERLTNTDWDRDGTIGEPEPAKAAPLDVKLYTNGGRNMEVIELPSADLLPGLAAGLLAGKPLSQSSWTGSAGPYSRSQFDELRNEMLKRGLARWKNEQAPAQGCELTPAGRAVMRRIDEHARTA